MTLILGLPFAFKQAGLIEGAVVMTLVAVGSVKAMLLLIECKYKCLSVLVPDLSNVRISDGKGYTPVKNEDHLSDDDDKHNKSNNSTRYLQGEPKGSERFLKSGCGSQMSQATPTKFSMLFKHNYGKLF